MAAELSTGVLALQAVTQSKHRLSMLVTANSSVFHKKATSRTYFTCDEGRKLIEAIQAAIQTGEGQRVTVVSKGIDRDGQAIADFTFEWSFKLKTKP